MIKNQSGNVLFYILIAVALLAGLSYAVAINSRGTVSQVSEERAKLLATEIIEYGNAVAQATAQIRLRGYRDTEISFENIFVAGYENPNCTEGDCNVFNIREGGGITWTDPPPGANDGTDWIVTANRVPHIGNDSGGAYDLMLVLPNVDQAVCQQINNKLHKTTAIPQADGQFSVTVQFAGTYTGRPLASGNTLNGMHAYCVEGVTIPAAGTYHYYHVILPR